MLFSALPHINLSLATHQPPALPNFSFSLLYTRSHCLMRAMATLITAMPHAVTSDTLMSFQAPGALNFVVRRFPVSALSCIVFALLDATFYATVSSAANRCFESVKPCLQLSELSCTSWHCELFSVLLSALLCIVLSSSSNMPHRLERRTYAMNTPFSIVRRCSVVCRAPSR